MNITEKKPYSCICSAMQCIQEIKIILCPRNYKNIMIALERFYQMSMGKLVFIFLAI
jgi:hypothetical protein